jgi:hypothetical protein
MAITTFPLAVPEHLGKRMAVVQVFRIDTRFGRNFAMWHMFVTQPTEIDLAIVRVDLRVKAGEVMPNLVLS